MIYKKYPKGLKFKALIHSMALIQGKEYETIMGSDIGVVFTNDLNRPDYIPEAEFNGTIELLTPIVNVVKTQASQFNIPLQRCAHEFKNYIGLVDTYEYCTKCDAKKGKS